MAAKNKITAKKGRRVRKNFRLNSTIARALAQRSNELNISETKLAEIALLELLLEKDRFICCPECKAYVGFKKDINDLEPYHGWECHICKSQLIIDSKTLKILTLTPTPKKPLKKGQTSAGKSPPR